MFQNIFRPIGWIWCEFHEDISTNLVKLIWLNEFFFGTRFPWLFQEFFGIFRYITLLLLLQKLAAPLNPTLTFFRSLLRFGRDSISKSPSLFSVRINIKPKYTVTFLTGKLFCEKYLFGSSKMEFSLEAIKFSKSTF